MQIDLFFCAQIALRVSKIEVMMHMCLIIIFSGKVFDNKEEEKQLIHWENKVK